MVLTTSSYFHLLCFTWGCGAADEEGRLKRTRSRARGRRAIWSRPIAAKLSCLYCPLQKTPPRLILVFTPPATGYCRRRRRTTHQIFCWIVRHKVKQKLNIVFSFIRAPSHTIWRNWWPWRPVKVRNPSFLLVGIWPNPNWLLLVMTLIIDHVNVGRRRKYKKERNWHCTNIQGNATV